MLHHLSQSALSSLGTIHFTLRKAGDLLGGGAKDPSPFLFSFFPSAALKEMKNVVPPRLLLGKKRESWTSPHLSLLGCISSATPLNAPQLILKGVNFWVVRENRGINSALPLLYLTQNYTLPSSIARRKLSRIFPPWGSSHKRNVLAIFHENSPETTRIPSHSSKQPQVLFYICLSQKNPGKA